ncbi:MAG: PfkB family carbohydrate kinase [bacterium]
METTRASELINNFSKYRVLVVGDVLLDHYVHGIVERLNPEAPVPILRSTQEREETGGAGNVAKNAARLGARTSLVSVVGDDAVASRVEQAAGREGYRATLIRDASRPTIRKVRYLVNGQHLLRVDHEETHDISEDIEDRIVQAIKEEITSGVDAIIVSDYAKGMITSKVAETILSLASHRDLLVAADVKPSRAPYFLGATFISPNIKEAHEYLGLNQHERKLEPAELAKMVYMKMCADVYLTMGKDGMFVYCGGECGVHVPQDNVVEVADESGAGDTSVVVLLLGLLSGASQEEASYLANAGGAVVVSKVGSVGITREELMQMVVRHKHEQEKSHIS